MPVAVRAAGRRRAVAPRSSRRADWPERLAAAIETARPFGNGYYCVTFAADCLLAMTDQDYMGGYRGLSRHEAAARLKAAGHRSFYHYLVKTFGQPVPLSQAQRGDLVVRTVEGIAVGICCGSVTAFASSDDGTAFQPTLEQRWCFPVR